MAGFLTDDWVRALHDAARSMRPPPDVSVTIQQVVVDDDGSEVAFTVTIEDGRVSVETGRAEAPQVTFTQDRETALSIASGALSAQAAFIAGRLRIGGDLRLAMAATDAVVGLPDDFATLRAATDW